MLKASTKREGGHSLDSLDKGKVMILFTIFNISSQITRIKRRVNERKCVSNRDTPFHSLPQNAKIGFKAFTAAQPRPQQLRPPELNGSSSMRAL
jgi:hypothetical protein